MPARTLAQMHQSGYGACKDVPSGQISPKHGIFSHSRGLLRRRGSLPRTKGSAVSVGGDIAGVAAWRSGRRGEPRSQQGLRVGWIAGRLEPYSMGGASQAQICQEEGVTPGSQTWPGAGGVGVQMSSLASAPVGQREGVRRRDMEAI